MDFRQLRYIVMVADCKSVTKAAAELYMSQPALSHVIQKAEAELGVVLFDRSTNPIKLTYAGEEYVKNARSILMINEAMIKKFQDISGNRTGRLRLGMPRDRASYMLPALLRRFYTLYPGIEIKTTTAGGDQLKEQLLKGRIDFMILPFFGKEPGLDVQKIYEEELLLAAPKGMIGPGHLMDGSETAVDMLKIAKLPLMLLPEGRVGRSALQVLFRSYRINPVVLAEYDSNITLLRMAAQGLGVTILPQMIIDLAKYDSGVAFFNLGAPPITWEIHAVFRKDAYISQAERDLFKLAAELFARKAPPSPSKSPAPF